MSAIASVLGVLGLCRVGFGCPTQSERPESLVCTLGVLGVLGLSTRARVRVIFCSAISGRKNIYARTNKPNTPNTLNTDVPNPLNSLGFECVGFVLGWVILCWVYFLEGSR